ncbi:MAG: hypothetical protein QG573_136 [Acidobacteriota bacterium]|nr:hypothetical protein [Acidobacteriota bacterium]
MKWLRHVAAQAGGSSQRFAQATGFDDRRLPTVDFPADTQPCPICAGDLRVHKSHRRTVVTLAHGAFEAREAWMACPTHPAASPTGSQRLRTLVAPHQRFGYDLIVHVGLARYRDSQQREEIRAELQERHGILLSTGSVSLLCDRFLLLLEALHLQHVPALRAAMTGGYPLHLDATCEKGKGGLFLCLDGWRHWVLQAARIPSENQVYLAPVVARTVALFGDPVATVRDLGDAGAAAVKPLRDREIPDLVCHDPFLRAVGDNLFDEPYDQLRGLLRTTGLRGELHSLLRQLRRCAGSEGADRALSSVRERETLPALVLWMIEGEGHKEAAYPFGLPHLDFVHRCRDAARRADQWLPTPRTAVERQVLHRIAGLVARLDRDARLTRAAAQLDERRAAFDELRDVLWLTHAEWPGGERCGQAELPALALHRLQKIERAVAAYRRELQRRVVREAKQEEERFSTATVILKYLDRYADHLFGHPARYADDGTLQAVVDRTNNVAEHFFGRDKQRLRRRLGRAHLGRDLQQQPAQAALVPNLEHPDYVKALCGSLDRLPAAFAALDDEARAQATPLVRDHRDAQLQREIRNRLEHEIETDVDDDPGTT